jgi:menaquinol-cytochrome c reductase iron-sulfur subunit
MSSVDLGADREPGAGPRRGFLAILAGAAGALIGAMGALPAFIFLGHSLHAKKSSGRDEAPPVAKPDDLRVGKPLRVTVYGSLRDGWTRVDHARLGAAWLVLMADGRVRAFSTVCPHLGCGVDWNDKAGTFDCPCHNSGFAADGRCLRGPSPRGLDELEVLASDKDIRIRYQRFKVGSKAKEPIG